MKTLVVLSVLATIALAAPAQQDNDFNDAARLFQGDLHIPEHMKREKKSSELSSDTIMHKEPAAEPHTDVVTSAFTGRNTFKKPIIVKKKVDYHKYRDSDEENMKTDSSEICGRHLKVKLCTEDEKFRELLKNSDISKVQGLEQDMKNSIRKAKEAVDNLQRDFKKMEKDNDANKQEDQSNPNVESDIEIARQMLQHLQDHFGNLTAESLTTRDAEDGHFVLAKSEEEKMAQWKDAMSNMQNNADLATNIEDSLKSSSGDLARRLLQNQNKQDQKLENTTTEAPSNDQRMRDAQIMHLDHTDDHKRSISDQSSMEHLNDVLNRRGQQLEDDMKSSASENIQMKSINIENHHTLMSENQEQDKSAMEDITGIHNRLIKAEEGVSAKNSELSAAESMVSKKQEQSLEKNDDVKKFAKESSFKNSQSNHKMSIASHESNFQLKDSKDHLKQDMNKKIQAKAVEHMIDSNKKENTLQDAKLRDHMERSHVPNESIQKPFSENMEEKSLLKSAEKSHPQKMHNLMEKNENFMNVADQAEQARKHLSDHKATSSNMKSTEEPFQTSTGNNLDGNHKKIMKLSDLDHKDRNNIKNIDYNETEHEQALKMKSSEDHVHLTDLFSIDNEKHESLMKAAQNGSCDDSDQEESETGMRSVENNSMKSLDHESAHSQQYNNKKPQLDQATMTKTKSTGDIVLNELHKTNQANHVDMSVDDNTQQKPKNLHNIHMDSLQKSLISEKKSAEEPWRHHLSSLKSPEDHMHHHLHHADAMHGAHWAHENEPMASMKVAGELMKDFHGHDHRKNSQIREDQHMPHKMRVMHDVDLLEHAHASVHAAARQHHNMKSHSNIHDMNSMSESKMQSNLHANMRDAMDGLDSDHMFRWLPSHDVPRTAYGGGGGSSSSSGGAVGVFPNANTGGCGIPLLLSCSPSVVSGSLAKPHTPAPPSYPSPSYRTEDNFGFHNKRDVKKSTEHSTNILRAPAIMKQKAGTSMKIQ